MLANLDIFKQKNPPYHTGTCHLLIDEQMAWCMEEGMEKIHRVVLGRQFHSFRIKITIFCIFFLQNNIMAGSPLLLIPSTMVVLAGKELSTQCVEARV